MFASPSGFKNLVSAIHYEIAPYQAGDNITRQAGANVTRLPYITAAGTYHTEERLCFSLS